MIKNCSQVQPKKKQKKRHYQLQDCCCGNLKVVPRASQLVMVMMTFNQGVCFSLHPAGGFDLQAFGKFAVLSQWFHIIKMHSDLMAGCYIQPLYSDRCTSHSEGDGAASKLYKLLFIQQHNYSHTKSAKDIIVLLTHWTVTGFIASGAFIADFWPFYLTADFHPQLRGHMCTWRLKDEKVFCFHIQV